MSFSVIVFAASGRPNTCRFVLAGLASRTADGYLARIGWLAQLVERLAYTENVGGSSPSPPTIRPTSVDLPRLTGAPSY